MAKAKPMHTVKTYPKESIQKLEDLLKELSLTMADLDKIDEEICSNPNPTSDQLKSWARTAQGKGNYIRKKFARLDSAVKNEKAHRFMEIKMECSEKELDFTASAAEIESNSYVSFLRTTRDILESYVSSADKIVSVCRMHIQSQTQDQYNPMEEEG